MVIIAGPDIEVVRAQIPGMGQEGEIATGLLDAVDLGIFGQHLIGVGSKGYAGAAGNIIQDDGKVSPVGNILIVLDQTGLACLVIIGGDVEQGICTGILCVLGQVDGGRGVVAAGTSDDLDTVIYPLDNVLTNRHGSGLTSGAADTHRIHAGGDLVVDQLSEGVVVDAAVLVKGSDQRGTGTGKNRTSHKQYTLSSNAGSKEGDLLAHL